MAKKTKSLWIKVTAIVLVVALVLGGGLFLWFNRRPTITIASRAEVIDLWNEQGITTWLENYLNVRINWLDYGVYDDIFERVGQDLHLEAQDLPDAYLGLGLSTQDIHALQQQHHFLDFSNLRQDHAPNLDAIISRDIDRLPDFLLNGQMISFPSFNENFARAYPQKAWINTQWLRESGMTMPSTPQELLEVLRVFQRDQTDGSPVLGAAYGGGAAEQFETTLGFLVSAFLHTQFDLSDSANYLNVDMNGQVYAAVTTPAYREALRFLNRLYEENLISSTVFTQGRDAFFGGGLGNENYGIVLASCLYHLFNDVERAAAFEALPPLNTGGHRSTVVRNQPVQMGGLMIPNRVGVEDFDRVERALAFGDAMMGSEGTLTVLFGNQGWSNAREDALAMGAQNASWRLETGFNGLELYGGVVGTPGTEEEPGHQVFTPFVPFWYDARLQMEREAPDTNGTLHTSDNWQGWLKSVTWDHYASVGAGARAAMLPQLVPDHYVMEQLNQIEVIDYIVRASREFITGGRSLDADWAAYVNHLNQLGLQDIIQAMQTELDLVIGGEVQDTPNFTPTPPAQPGDDIDNDNDQSVFDWGEGNQPGVPGEDLNDNENEAGNELAQDNEE